MPSGPIRRQRYDVIVAEVAAAKDIIWKLLGSHSKYSGAAYNHLADARQLSTELGADLFVKDDLAAAAERCRRLGAALHQASSNLKLFAQEQGAGVERALQHIELALALLRKMADDISPEDTLADEI